MTDENYDEGQIGDELAEYAEMQAMSDDEWEEVCNPKAAAYRKKEPEHLDHRRNEAGKECISLADILNESWLEGPQEDWGRDE
jgi:hypothetical protein